LFSVIFFNKSDFMLKFPEIDPVIVSIGPIALRWYGLMYVLGFLATFFLVRRKIQQRGLTRLAAQFDNLNMVLLLSLVAGGRLGYVLFYNLSYYMEHPLQSFNTMAGGMSFHGGMLGVIIGGIWYCRRVGLDFLENADLYVATLPIGLGFGRIGNFINGELYGRVTDVPWGMIFPAGGNVVRHPSQLYEAFLEGVVLFGLLAWMGSLKDKRGWRHGSILAFFIIYYGVLRCFVELFRAPDSHIGLMAGVLSRGQLLSGIMIVAGRVFFWFLNRKRAGGI
jgi:phosphatidylglycerol:prolipoprotein diacylglycerol transferase